jgi:HAD superfamily hydrolase (TIGR01509 family)
MAGKANTDHDSMTTDKGAILFDIDGTLADTDPIHIRAFNAMLGRFGRHISDQDYFAQVMGFTNASIMQNFFPEKTSDEHKALADWKEASFRELAKSELHPTPGLYDLMDWADSRGITMAAVTNAPLPNADLILSSLNVKHRFRTIVIGDDLPRGKPDPMPYLVAGERLDIECRNCVAFEDSRSGMRSASASGAFSIGVLSSLPEAELVKVGARYGIKDFNDARLRPQILETISASQK